MARFRAAPAVCPDARAELAAAFAALWAVPITYADSAAARWPVLSPSTVDALCAAAERVAELAGRDCPAAEPCDTCAALHLAYYMESVQHPCGPHHDALGTVRFVGAEAYRATWRRWYDRLPGASAGADRSG